jgi:hypothetical protein
MDSKRQQKNIMHCHVLKNLSPWSKKMTHPAHHDPPNTDYIHRVQYKWSSKALKADFKMIWQLFTGLIILNPIGFFTVCLGV